MCWPLAQTKQPRHGDLNLKIFSTLPSEFKLNATRHAFSHPRDSNRSSAFGQLKSHVSEVAATLRVTATSELSCKVLAMN